MAQAEADDDAEGAEFLRAGIQSIDAVLDFAEKYRRSAEAQGLGEIAKTLAQVPRRGARTTLEAMQSFRVNSHTPIERLELVARLTRAGLGFPQYSNDDVVLPALAA